MFFQVNYNFCKGKNNLERDLIKCKFLIPDLGYFLEGDVGHVELDGPFLPEVV